jgi:hypothetical protein
LFFFESAKFIKHPPLQEVEGEQEAKTEQYKERGYTYTKTMQRTPLGKTQHAQNNRESRQKLPNKAKQQSPNH